MSNFGFDPYSDFDGEGHASFLDASVEAGILAHDRESPCRPQGGYFTIASAKDPHDSIELTVDFLLSGEATYEVIKGTGRFAKATGSGTWAHTETGDHYEDTWTGTLNF